MSEAKEYFALKECGYIDKWYHKRTIELWPADAAVPALVTIYIPNDKDDDEYIDAYLDGMLNEFLRYNCDWVFA